MAVTRRAAVKGLIAAGLGAAVGAGAYGNMYERHRVGVTRVALPISGLPEQLHGLRVGLMTDIHRSSSVSHEYVSHAVRLLLEEKPDLIVLGGDYVTWGNRRYVGPAADALAPLSAPHGVFAILGNHDDDRDMPAALSARGFEVLKDARTRVVARGESLELVGIRYWTRKAADIAQLLRGALGSTIVLLAHDPRRLAEAASLDVPLLLSGHTHGGQVVLPGVSAALGRMFPILAGVTRRDNTMLFVSRGIGTVYVPCRLNCPPEVAILTLERQSQI